MNRLTALALVLIVAALNACCCPIVPPAQPKPKTVDPQTQLANNPKTDGPLAKPQDIQATMTRAEAKEKFIGMTTADLITDIGRPLSTHDLSKNGSLWSYHGLTIDEVNGKKDSSITFTIRDGKVQSLRVSP